MIHDIIVETGNLIDLNSDGTSTNFNIPPEHNYVNDSVIATRENQRDQTSLFDVFDMRK